MEINYTEYNPNDINDINYSKYWEPDDKPEVKETKKKKVSFNDILSNMNLVVGKNGVLQQMKSLEPPQYYNQEPQYYNQEPPQYYNQEPPQYYNKPMQTTKVIKEQSIQPEVKHSYIYNKYFKDYADIYKPEPKVLIPKTIEEYRQMVLEERQKAIEERKRVSEIKSTKLMFTTNQGYNVNNSTPRNIQSSKNNLRSMNFR